MAICLRRPLKLLALMPELVAVAGSNISGVRCGSSSSSSQSSTSSGKSSKAEKRLVDRLSAVIDAVNDRKLPPELRGQRNNVR